LGQDLHNKFVEIHANDMIFDKNNLIEHIQGTLYDFEGKATFLKNIISKQNISPLNVLYVGNSSNDEFASRSGARTLCVTPHKTNPDDYKKWTHHISYMKNLSDILKYVYD
jgi:phosphoserine phosphatase